ncbi:hypothetical protein ACFYUL_17760 [Streptomyces sp. NPDC004311]
MPKNVPDSSWTPEQRAGQQRLQDRLAEARRAPREPKRSTKDVGGRR